MQGNRESLSAKIEWGFEKALFLGRYILVFFYVSLLIAAAATFVVFVGELLHLGEVLSSADAAVVAILHLIDLTLLANLLVMVALASYDNFVSALLNESAKDRPQWLDRVDLSNMKLKMLGSIVAISAIQLLSSLMDVGNKDPEDIMWQVIIHLAVAASAVLMAVTDKLGHQAGHEPGINTSASQEANAVGSSQVAVRAE